MGSPVISTLLADTEISNEQETRLGTLQSTDLRRVSLTLYLSPSLCSSSSLLNVTRQRLQPMLVAFRAPSLVSGPRATPVPFNFVDSTPIFLCCRLNLLQPSPYDGARLFRAFISNSRDARRRYARNKGVYVKRAYIGADSFFLFTEEGC